jgi:translation initiation factor 3 subunit B
VYECPSLALVEKKSVKIEGVMGFEWCPMGEKDKEQATASGKGKMKKENVFAYWTPEVSNQPARVTLMGFPSRQVLRSKNLFNVSDVSHLSPFIILLLHFLSLVSFSLERSEADHSSLFSPSTLIPIPYRLPRSSYSNSQAKLHWQDQGDFLCVKVDRHTKTKKSTFCNLEVFRMREKDYPVEVIELKGAFLPFFSFQYTPPLSPAHF